CWWYDGPSVACHYDAPEGGWPPGGPPWEGVGPKLAALMETWRTAKEEEAPGFSWVRSLRPPTFPLGDPQRVVIPVDTDRVRFGGLDLGQGDGYVGGGFHPRSRADVSNPTVRVWESATGREVDSIREQDFPIHPLNVSLDGRWRLLFGGEGGGWGKPIRLCDVRTGAAVAFATHEDVNISCVALSPDGRRIVAGGYGEDAEGVMMVWDAASRKRIAWVSPNR